MKVWYLSHTLILHLHSMRTPYIVLTLLYQNLVGKILSCCVQRYTITCSSQYGCVKRLYEYITLSVWTNRKSQICIDITLIFLNVSECYRGMILYRYIYLDLIPFCRLRGQKRGGGMAHISEGLLVPGLSIYYISLYIL